MVCLYLRHGLYVATNTDHTYHHSINSDNSGKSTIDLTLTRGINNIHIKTLNIDEIKTRHNAIVINIGDNNNTQSSKTPHFKTKNANWDQWQYYLEQNLLKKIVNSYPQQIKKN